MRHTRLIGAIPEHPLSKAVLPHQHCVQEKEKACQNLSLSRSPRDTTALLLRKEPTGYATQ